MPYIPNPLPILAVKLVGYTAAGAVLRKHYGGGPHPILFGVIRVVCGFFLGLLTLPVVAFFGDDGGNMALFVWLFISRLVVWTGLVFLMFEHNSISKTGRVTVVGLGIAWSFLLDGLLYLLDQISPGIMSIPMC
jgi:hypothetical protein